MDMTTEYSTGGGARPHVVAPVGVSTSVCSSGGRYQVLGKTPDCSSGVGGGVTTTDCSSGWGTTIDVAQVGVKPQIVA